MVITYFILFLLSVHFVVYIQAQNFNSKNSFDYPANLPPDNNDRYNQQFPAGIDAYLPPSADKAYGGYIPKINVNIGGQLQGMHNPCQYYPCKNGGICGQMTIKSFVCYCKKPYTGDTCEISNKNNNLVFIILLSTLVPLLFILLVVSYIYFCVCHHKICPRTTHVHKNKRNNHDIDVTQNDVEAGRVMNPNDETQYTTYYDDNRRPIDY